MDAHALLPRVAGIYRIVHLDSAREYVGSATDLRRRARHHIFRLRNGTHHSPHLRNAFRKYGEESFAFSIIEFCDPSQLIVREQWNMDDRKPVFNATTRAGSNLGVKFSEEIRKKMSVSAKRRASTPEYRAFISAINTGKNLSAEHRIKLSIAGRGRKVSEETRRKQSIALKGKPMPWLRTPEVIAKANAKRIGKKLSESHKQSILDGRRRNKARVGPNQLTMQLYGC